MDLQQAAELNSTKKLRRLMLVSFEGLSVADFDTQSAFSRW
jgi:hypothetical protein